MNYKLASTLGVLGLWALCLGACSPVNFSGSQGSDDSRVSGPSIPGTPVASGGTTATTPTPTPGPLVCPTPSTIQTASRLTKITFLVDTSGSNEHATCDVFNPDNCFDATDPDRKFRAGSIQNFLTTYGKKTNFQWSLDTFADTTAHALIKYKTNDQLPLFGLLTDMQQALQNFLSNVTDIGETPYSAALKLATTGILTDPDLATKSSPQYIVVMMTDGMPSDYATSAQAAQDMKNLLNAAPGRVSFSTVYYGPTNPGAQQLLQDLAQMGKGKFAQAVDGGVIDISDVIVLPQPTPPPGCP